MLALELLPGVTVADAGFPDVVASVERLDRCTLHLVNTDAPVGRCQMLTGEKNPNTGETKHLGWAHGSSCDLTQALVSGDGNGRCTGGTP